MFSLPASYRTNIFLTFVKLNWSLFKIELNSFLSVNPLCVLPLFAMVSELGHNKGIFTILTVVRSVCVYMLWISTHVDLVQFSSNNQSFTVKVNLQNITEKKDGNWLWLTWGQGALLGQKVVCFKCQEVISEAWTWIQLWFTDVTLLTYRLSTR